MIDFSSKFREFNSRIEIAQHIVITTHVNPDGDAIGSQLALYRFLNKHSKKRIKMINISPTPGSYKFMDPQEKIEHFNIQTHSHFVENCDLIIALDIGDFKRMGIIGDIAKRKKISVLSMDHHPSHDSNGYFIQEIIDTDACSTGTMLFDYIQFTNSKLMDAEIAKNIYIAIITDTGNFRYSNTRSYTHKVAEILLKYDIESNEIYTQIYEQYDASRMRLLGEVLSNLHYECDNKFVWFKISKETLNKVNSTTEDTDGFSDFMRSIKGVEIAMMLKEREDGTTRVNFRSKGRYSINEMAKILGGGGHPFACGAVVNKSFSDEADSIKDKTIKYLNNLFKY